MINAEGNILVAQFHLLKNVSKIWCINRNDASGTYCINRNSASIRDGSTATMAAVCTASTEFVRVKYGASNATMTAVSIASTETVRVQYGESTATMIAARNNRNSASELR